MVILMQRLQKVIALSGYCSRRKAEELISLGRVKVNGKKIDTPGLEINEFNDAVTLDGRRITLVSKKYYIMLHKPKGYVTTVKDDKGRKTVMELIKIRSRLYPVGRLDYDTEGLLLLTNDGQLAYALTHPSHEVPKTYIAKIKGKISDTEVRQLRKGVEIDGKMTLPAVVKIIETDDEFSRVEVTIKEGRNHQIKKMFEVVGKEVVFLKRTAIGPLKLGGLGRGEYKNLTSKEIEILKAMVK